MGCRKFLYSIETTIYHRNKNNATVDGVSTSWLSYITSARLRCSSIPTFFNSSPDLGFLIGAYPNETPQLSAAR